jgi:hypothetical protein
MTDARQPPEATPSDIVHKVVKGTLSMIPIVGGTAAELFAAIVIPPLERRRAEWMRAVGKDLQRLEAEGKINVDELANSDEFIDTVLQATQIALRNQKEEKLRALRAAVVHTAQGLSPGETLRHIFLRYVDELTEWHLRVLELFHDPKTWYERNTKEPPSFIMGGLSSILEDALPELRDKRPIYDQIWTDLYQRGLVNTQGLHSTMSGTGLFARRTSELGARFLAFIQEPRQAEY